MKYRNHELKVNTNLHFVLYLFLLDINKIFRLIMQKKLNI